MEPEEVRQILLVGVHDPNIATEEYVSAVRDGVITREELENSSMAPDRIELIYELLDRPSVISGCTDPNAENFNPMATEDDGSCVFAPVPPPPVIRGCTDPAAENFNPEAIEDDGSCVFAPVPPPPVIRGCTDPAAENFNPEAIEDDGSCTYPKADIFGCIDPIASNFNPEATVDDGSCIYGPAQAIFGCTDSNAINYNPNATQDDGSCEYQAHDFLIQGEVLCENSPLSEVSVHLMVATSNHSCNTNARGVFSQIVPSEFSGESCTLELSADQLEPLTITLLLDGSAPLVEEQRLITLNAEMHRIPLPEPPEPPSPLCQRFENKTFETIIRDYMEGEEGDGTVLMDCLGLEENELAMAVRQLQENPPILWDNKIPVLQARHTDHWLLGVSASGKSAMLASMIYELRQRLILPPLDDHNRTGIRYRTYLRQCMLNQYMPQDTQTTGQNNKAIFAYMPFSLSLLQSGNNKKSGFSLFPKKKKALRKPINLIEMAGEHVSGLLEQDAALEKLDWFKSKNRKILSLVFDASKSDSGSQVTSLVECLNLFHQKRVFDRIDKVFLIITKADLMEDYHIFKQNDNIELAYEGFVEAVRARIYEDWPELVNTINEYINQSGQDISFQVVPMSVATELVKGIFIKKKEDIFIKKYVAEMERNLLIH